MTKTKTKKKPINARLARIHGLIDELWCDLDIGELPVKRMLDAVNWGSVEEQKIKRIFAILFEGSEPDYPDAEDRREALSKIADDEHRAICACCRSDKKTIGRAA